MFVLNEIQCVAQRRRIIDHNIKPLKAAFLLLIVLVPFNLIIVSKLIHWLNLSSSKRFHWQQFSQSMKLTNKLGQRIVGKFGGQIWLTIIIWPTNCQNIQQTVWWTSHKLALAVQSLAPSGTMCQQIYNCLSICYVTQGKTINPYSK